MSDCMMPSNVSNANVTYTGTTFGSVAAYTCHPGYNITGDVSVSCTEDGTWSAAPNCTIKGTVYMCEWTFIPG